MNVLWKPFDSEKDWVSTAASRRADGSYGAAVAGNGEGALFAVEVRTTGGAWRYPDALTTTPYVSVAPGDSPP